MPFLCLAGLVEGNGFASWSIVSIMLGVGTLGKNARAAG